MLDVIIHVRGDALKPMLLLFSHAEDGAKGYILRNMKILPSWSSSILWWYLIFWYLVTMSTCALRSLSLTSLTTLLTPLRRGRFLASLTTLLTTLRRGRFLGHRNFLIPFWSLWLVRFLGGLWLVRWLLSSIFRLGCMIGSTMNKQLAFIQLLLRCAWSCFGRAGPLHTAGLLAWRLSRFLTMLSSALWPSRLSLMMSVMMVMTFLIIRETTDQLSGRVVFPIPTILTAMTVSILRNFAC